MGPGSSLLAQNTCEVLSLVGSILGFILLKLPSAATFSGPPPQEIGPLSCFIKKVLRCVETSLRSICAKILDCTTWLSFKNWVAIGQFGPRQLPTLPHSIGPPTQWGSQKFKNVRRCGSAIGLVQHWWTQHPKLSC